jgi:hypothetical protein
MLYPSELHALAGTAGLEPATFFFEVSDVYTTEDKTREQAARVLTCHR